jgi:predicted XRE-type DNA-binding protein
MAADVRDGGDNLYLESRRPVLNRKRLKWWLALQVCSAIKNRGLTQEAAGVMLGLSQSHLSDMMRGAREGSAERFMGFLVALECKVEIRLTRWISA